MANQNCTDIARLHECALLVVANADLLRQWVNGDEQTDVTLGGKLTPSIRKLVAEIDVRESAAAQKVIDAGLEQIAQLGDDIEARAAAEADRAERAATLAEVCAGCTANEVWWTIDADIPAGSEITFPNGFAYIYGRHHLHCTNGGVFVSPLHYEEVGTTPGEICTAIRILYPLKAGETFHAWVSPLGYGCNAEVEDQMAAMAAAIAQQQAIIEAQQQVIESLQQAVEELRGFHAQSVYALNPAGEAVTVFALDEAGQQQTVFVMDDAQN